MNELSNRHAEIPYSLWKPVGDVCNKNQIEFVLLATKDATRSFHVMIKVPDKDTAKRIACIFNCIKTTCFSGAVCVDDSSVRLMNYSDSYLPNFVDKVLALGEEFKWMGKNADEYSFEGSRALRFREDHYFHSRRYLPRDYYTAIEILKKCALLSPSGVKNKADAQVLSSCEIPNSLSSQDTGSQSRDVELASRARYQEIDWNRMDKISETFISSVPMQIKPSNHFLGWFDQIGLFSDSLKYGPLRPDCSDTKSSPQRDEDDPFDSSPVVSPR